MSDSALPTDIEEILDIDKLRAWAESKSPYSVVGMQGDPFCCPISTYLAETLGVDDTVSTTAGSITIYAGSIHNNIVRRYYHNDLTRNVLVEVDCLERTRNNVVYRGRFLDVLKRVAKQLG